MQHARLWIERYAIKRDCSVSGDQHETASGGQITYNGGRRKRATLRYRPARWTHLRWHKRGRMIETIASDYCTHALTGTHARGHRLRGTSNSTEAPARATCTVLCCSLVDGVGAAAQGAPGADKASPQSTAD
jgi:hypothetical protein